MASKAIRLAGLAALLLAVSIAYSNHFRNGFHFDDFHTITDNPNIRSLKNAGRFFTDTSTFSIRPKFQTYRPLVSLSVAFDYWLGGGLKPFYFHLDMFLCFLGQLGLMFALFRHLLRQTANQPSSDWAALFAVALYGLHPAAAQTVNYIIQRGDLYSTLLVVAALTIYAMAPALRRFGIYLLPLAAAMLTKPPAAIFPAILFAYVWLFEERRTGKALLRCAPSLGIVALTMWLQARMTPATFDPGGIPMGQYLVTQTWVALHYFLMFFAPVGLTAASEQEPIRTVFCFEGMAGMVFLLALAAAIYASARKEQLRPVAFGLAWFMLALIPTSVYPLFELENDHRMFFPFVGLALAVSWSAALLVTDARVGIPRLAIPAAAVTLLAACAWGTHRRNEVWLDSESLWLDATIQSPHAGVAWTNYGNALLIKSQPAAALASMQRALAYLPNDFALEERLGNAYAALRMDDAERHYLRAIELAPLDADPGYYYGSWLHSQGRSREAIVQFQSAIARSHDYLAPRHALMQTYWDEGMQPEAKTAALETLRINPGDETAQRILNGKALAQALPNAAAAAEAAVKLAPTADNYLKLSAMYGRLGRFRECIQAAGQVLKLQPNSAVAYSNIARAHMQLGEWDEAIAAASEAVRLKPDYQQAQQILAYAAQQKNTVSDKKP